MTLCLCLAVPGKTKAIKTFFSDRVDLEIISKTTLGRAALGNRLDGDAYLLSVSGCTEVLMDYGFKRDHSSCLFVDAVHRLTGELPPVSFLIAWMNSETWENEYILGGKETLSLNDFLNRYPKLMLTGIRYTVLPNFSKHQEVSVK